jgi:hypothetical protein
MTGAGAAHHFKDKLQTKGIAHERWPRQLSRAILVHNQAMIAMENFHTLYVEGRGQGNGREVSDLLRAMLLFACAGLDAVIKQLVHDTLGSVLEHDDGAQREFKKFVERRLKKAPSADERERVLGLPDVALLADLLVSFDLRARLVGYLTDALVADSLQSRDQLLRVAAHFALTMDDVMANSKVTQEAFSARNQITHEMDIEGGVGQRERTYHDMVRWCENIADISRCFIEKVGAKVEKPIRAEPNDPPKPSRLSRGKRTRLRALTRSPRGKRKKLRVLRVSKHPGSPDA